MSTDQNKAPASVFVVVDALGLRTGGVWAEERWAKTNSSRHLGERVVRYVREDLQEEKLKRENTAMKDAIFKALNILHTRSMNEELRDKLQKALECPLDEIVSVTEESDDA